jgi:hypothetical protein
MASMNCREVVPAVSKLHRMNVLLKEHEWEEGHEEEEDHEIFRVVSWGQIHTVARLREIVFRGNAETVYC